MNKHVIKSIGSGLYLIDGLGFAGTINQATRYTQDKANCIASTLKQVGTNATVEGVKSVSYAVVYIRQKDVTPTGELAKKQPNAALNEVDPSARRFATFEEARIHGSRFHVRKKNAGDPAGSAKHRGFFIIETTDPVNSAVNPSTGLTNSI